MKVVPWNTGGNDADADGEIPEFDFKRGPGTRLTQDEMGVIKARGDPMVVHRAHLRKADFETHGYTDRCGGCSATLRGLRGQPHADHCRQRMEKQLEDDVRIRNAKTRLEERSRRRASEGIVGKTLEDLEEAVMVEKDGEKLKSLFEEYRMEYPKALESDDQRDTRRQKMDSVSVQEKSSASTDQMADTMVDDVDVIHDMEVNQILK